MKLWYARYTRATRPRWMLEELGLPYELVRIDLRSGDHKRPEYLSVHPHGVVPALEVDGRVMLESVAMVRWLADAHPEAGLAPRPGSPERAAYEQWTTYAVATVEPLLDLYFRHTRILPEDRRVPHVADDARARLRTSWAVLTGALEGRTWLLDDFSAADVILASVLMWASSMGLLEDAPVLQAYAARASERPAYRRATAD